MVEYVSLPRGAGKTTRVIEWFCEDPHNRAVVTINYSEAERLYRLARKKSDCKVKREQFVTADKTTAGTLRGSRLDIAVDNFDLIPDVTCPHCLGSGLEPEDGFSEAYNEDGERNGCHRCFGRGKVMWPLPYNTRLVTMTP